MVFVGIPGPYVALIVDQSAPSGADLNRDLLRRFIERMITRDVSFESIDKRMNTLDRVFAKKAGKRLLQRLFCHLIILAAIASQRQYPTRAYGRRAVVRDAVAENGSVDFRYKRWV